MLQYVYIVKVVSCGEYNMSLEDKKHQNKIEKTPSKELAGVNTPLTQPQLHRLWAPGRPVLPQPLPQQRQEPLHDVPVYQTDCRETAEAFIALVDSAAVYWNVSTRFTDGGEFGLGCEMGISTQKLHARGPMGLEELCSYKYVITGNGQTR